MVETRSMRARRVIGEKWNQIESATNVFVDILSRLSVESLKSFKRVDKYWHRSISNKAFANMQLSRSRKTTCYITCPHADKDMVLHLMKPGGMVSHHFVSILGGGNSGTLHMVCSFNGLICYINDPSEDEEEDAILRDLQIRICNPATGDSLLLPQATPSLEIEPSIGVGYGPDISCYKVFRIYCVGKREPGGYHEPEEYNELEEAEDMDGSVEIYRYDCEVYSSSTGSWTYIGPVPRAPMRVFTCPHASTHVFVGGKIYWLVASHYPDTPGSVLSTDMEGNFRHFDLPDYGENSHDEDGITLHTFLFNLKGSLCLIILHLEHMDIWVLKDRAIKPAWQLNDMVKHRFPMEECITFVTACRNKILFATEAHWYTYDLRLRNWRSRRSCVDFCNPAAFIYTQSLLPCNGGVDHGNN